MRYRYRETVYPISVSQTTADVLGSTVTLDGIALHEGGIPLLDDRAEQRVEVKIVRGRKLVLAGAPHRAT